MTEKIALMTHFADVNDLRRDQRKRHVLSDVLTLTIEITAIPQLLKWLVLGRVEIRRCQTLSEPQYLDHIRRLRPGWYNGYLLKTLNC